MTDIIDDFRLRVSQNNSYSDGKSGFMYNLKSDFERSLLTDASAVDVEVYSVESQHDVTTKKKIIRAIINEIATNDQKSFDEKYLLTKVEDDIKYGTYIIFDNWYWIVNFQEYQTHSVYNKHVIRRCNKIVKFDYNFKNYDIPVVAKNLTQYSDGMQDIKYTSLSDNKISLMFGVNTITNNVKLGTRLIVGRNVYRTTFIEDYQFSGEYNNNTGLGNIIMIYDPKGKNDEIELGTIRPDNPPESFFDITGEVRVMPGGKFRYQYTGKENHSNLKFKINYNGLPVKFARLEGEYNTTYDLYTYLIVEDDFDLIGTLFEVQIVDKTDEYIVYSSRMVEITTF